MRESAGRREEGGGRREKGRWERGGGFGEEGRRERENDNTESDSITRS